MRSRSSSWDMYGLRSTIAGTECPMTALSVSEERVRGMKPPDLGAGSVVSDIVRGTLCVCL
eukprot:scaffold130967_cov21-Tisochrysis_lutea.AAC.3